MQSTSDLSLKGYLTLAEAIKVSKRSASTLRRAIASKRLSVCRPSGPHGMIFVRSQDLTQYMEGNRRVAIN